MINTNIDINSEQLMDHHMPSAPINKGKRNNNPIWINNVLIAANKPEAKPLFKAVKKDEPNILIPTNR